MRLTLEFNLLTRLADRFQSPNFLGRRRSAARHAMGRFNRAAYDVANFFEEVGYLHRRGVLRAESVWHTFGLPARVYWTVYGPTIRKMREEQNDPIVYEDFERLDRLVADLSDERGMPPPRGNDCAG